MRYLFLTKYQFYLNLILYLKTTECTLLKFRMGFQPRTIFCKWRNGNIFACDQQVLKIRAEYFKVILNKFL